MGQRRHIFPSRDYAEGFIEGVQFVNDSALTVVGESTQTTDGQWIVTTEDKDNTDEDDDDEPGDDLCDLCMSSQVNVSRTTYCGKTIGIQCGCDDDHPDGDCGDPKCKTCIKALAEQDEEEEASA